MSATTDSYLSGAKKVLREWCYCFRKRQLPPENAEDTRIEKLEAKLQTKYKGMKSLARGDDLFLPGLLAPLGQTALMERVSIFLKQVGHGVPFHPIEFVVGVTVLPTEALKGIGVD